MYNHSGGDIVALGTVSPTSWDLGPHPASTGDGVALGTVSPTSWDLGPQPASTSLEATCSTN